MIRRAKVLGPFRATHCLSDALLFFAVALPAIATNLATPVGNGIMIEYLSGHGDDAVAGLAIVSLIIPVAFGAVFALTGAIGRIIGQNYGAENFERIRAALWSTMAFSVVAVVLPALLFYLLEAEIVAAFHAKPECGARNLHLHRGCGPDVHLRRGLFIANVAFNNLGRPLWGTLSN